MKNKKNVFIFGLCLIIILIVIGTYFWFFFFLDLNTDGNFNDNDKLKGDLIFEDDDKVYAIYNKDSNNPLKTPSYNFTVRNNTNARKKYQLIFIEISPQKVNDGCDLDTLLKKDELLYELSLNGNVISEGNISDFSNSILDERIIDISTTNKYSLKIWVNEKISDYEGKHFHYKIELEDIE